MPRSTSPNLRADSSIIRFTAAARRAAARAGVDLIFHAYHLDDKYIDVEVGQHRPPNAALRATTEVAMADGCETGG